MSRILVTGSTGHLGKATIAFLLKNTAASNIVALARDKQKAQELADKGIEVRQGSYNDTASLESAMQGIDKVLLVSGLEEDRLQQHKNVVDAAKKAGVKHIVYTGVAFKDINSSAIKDFMNGHFLTEDYIKASGIGYTLMRNSLYFEAIANFAGHAPVETGIYLPAGDGKVPYALREEMAEAIANVLLSDEHLNKTYEITGGELYSFKDIADELSALSGKEVSYTDADEATFPEILRSKGVPEHIVFVASGFAADIKHHQYEILTNHLADLIGRKPAVLKDGLKGLYNL